MKPSASKKPRVWGLSGGIGTGKSTAARFFSEAGIPVVDADLVARELRAPGGAAEAAILKRFGTAEAVRLRAIVFADPTARRDLEAILHPLIREESSRRIAAAVAGKADPPPVIYEASLLVETGRFRDFEGLIVVTAGEPERVRRIVARDGCTDELARKLISSQAPESEKIAQADHVIENGGSLDDLRARVAALIPVLKQPLRTGS